MPLDPSVGAHCTVAHSYKVKRSALSVLRRARMRVSRPKGSNRTLLYKTTAKICSL